jgi:hypothetical protein
MRRRQYSIALVTTLLLHGCGGNDNPAAPTGGMTPTPTPTPIVVTVSAQVVDNAALQGVKGVIGHPPVENRNLRVTGDLEVAGGNATLGAQVLFTF